MAMLQPLYDMRLDQGGQALLAPGTAGTVALLVGIHPPISISEPIEQDTRVPPPWGNC